MKYKRHGKNFRRPSEVNRKWTDCDTCGGLGYFETNQSKGHMGISSCDTCKLFEDDLDVSLLNNDEDLRKDELAVKEKSFKFVNEVPKQSHITCGTTKLVA